MYCTNCGEKNIETSKFCCKCGTKLGNEENVETDNEILSIQNDKMDVNEWIKQHSKENRQDAFIFFKRDYRWNILFLEPEKYKEIKRKYGYEDKLTFKLERFSIVFPTSYVSIININKVQEYVIKEYINPFEQKSIRLSERYSLEEYCDECVNVMKQIADFSVKFLMHNLHNSVDASKLVDSYCYSEKLLNSIAPLWEECEKLLLEKQVNVNNMILKNALNKPIAYGGGFGLKGAVKGALSAGILNAGINYLSEFKTGFQEAAIDSKYKKQINEIFMNKNLEDLFIQELYYFSKFCIDEIIWYYEEKYNVCYGKCLHNHDDKEINDIFMQQDKEKKLNFVCKIMPHVSKYEEIINHLVSSYYLDEQLMSDIIEICDFLMISDVKEQILGLKKNLINHVFALPENTLSETYNKLIILNKECEKYNIDIKQLNEYRNLVELYNKQKNTLKLMNENIKNSEKLQLELKKNGISSISEAAYRGDVVAEELYIQYYIGKISSSNDYSLFDCISSQCGIHRAYDCIIGICCYFGYGTQKDYDVSKKLIESACKSGCTYAMAFTGYLYEKKEFRLLSKKDDNNYYQKALQRLSPYAYCLEGKKYCYDSEHGGSNSITNNYKLSSEYIVYSAKCGIKEAYPVVKYLKNQMNSH